MIGNMFIHNRFDGKNGWNLFPLRKMSEAVQYEFSQARDGLHPDKFVRVDHVRMLLEFIFNTLSET